LAGQTDTKSRKTLAAGCFQLAELTEKIGPQPEALEPFRKALSIWQKLVAANTEFQKGLANLRGGEVNDRHRRSAAETPVVCLPGGDRQPRHRKCPLMKSF
jgi:hypothetical protein